MAQLRVEAVVCRRGERPLFAPLSFLLGAGQVAWLRGANGHGKTTLLRTLAGLSTPDEGRVAWTGDTPRPIYLAHANGLKDDLPARDALRFLLGLDGVPSGDADVDAALDAVSMSARRHVPVRALSQGQRRRVALARLAAQRDPRTWLLDEPFDALDADGIALLTALLAAHAARGGSVVLTSHVPLAIATLSPATVDLAGADSGTDTGVDPRVGMSLFAAVVARDLRLAARRRTDALLPLAFFVVAASLFPFGVGPEPQTLRQIGPGIVWVSALLAAMLSLTQLYASDLADGSLEQMLLARPGLAIGLVAAKAVAHWLVTGLPLVIVAPVLGLMFDMRGDAIASLVVTLLLGTPSLSLLGGLGAGLVLGLRSGAALIVLLVVPLCLPALIFGAGAVSAVDSGLPAQGHYSLLAAFAIFTALVAVPATAASLRIATE